MLSGQGIGLPIPQAAFPALPFNFAQPPAANQFTLVAGGCIYVPAGWWAAYLGSYSVAEFLDPVSGGWLTIGSAGRSPFLQINSDGNNWRIWNPKGFPVSATVSAAGSGYVQSSTTVTASAGGSLWHAIVGGAVGTATVGNDSKGNAGGTNFTIPPTIVFSNPPTSLAGLPSTAVAQGGIVATGHATISGGAISAVTLDFAGAGYQSPPTIQVIPNPFDPNIGTITVPTITCVLTGAGTVTAVVMDYFGTTSGSAPTLTISGAGSSATATANIVATAASDTIILQPLGSWF